MTPLFRKEVLQQRTTKLYGEVMVPAHVPQIAITTILSLCFAGVVTILLLGVYTRVELVPGHLVPSNGIIKLYPREPSLISTTEVVEGQTVGKGEQLLTLKVESRGVDGKSTLENNLSILNEKIHLLTTEINLREQQYYREHELLIAKKIDAEQKRQSLVENLNIQNDIHLSQKSSAEDSAKLRRQGHLSRVEYERRIQSQLQSEQLLINIQNEISQAENKISNSKLEQRLLSIKHDSDIGRLKSNLLEVQRERISLETKAEFSITSPIDGYVSSLYEVPGRYVVPQDVVVAILPENSELIAELFVPSTAIAYVELGQKVRISYDAFPDQQFGPFWGEITTITRTILLPDENRSGFSTDQPAYKVTAKIFKQEVSSDNGTFLLHAGMRIKASISLEKLSFFNWLLGPLVNEASPK